MTNDEGNPNAQMTNNEVRRIDNLLFVIRHFFD